MGASGSTLEGAGNNSNETAGDGSNTNNNNASNSGTSKSHSKHSLKRRQRAQAQQQLNVDLTVPAGGEDALHRLQHGSTNATPSASTADLLAPSSTLSSDFPASSHFGTLSSTITESESGSNVTGKPSNVAFLGRYTPFPPPPTQMLMPSAQLMPSQTSSFSSAAKPLLADPRDPNVVSARTGEFGVDASTLVVLQDYEAGDTRNPISLRQGDSLHLISNADRGGSYEVCLPDAIPESSATFYIPQHVVMKCKGLDAFPWYHGRVSRADAERLLSSGIDGTFLVRESESSPGQLSVSLRSGQRVHHYRLTIDAGLWFLSPEWRFRTVPHLVRHHSRHPDGLACPLLYPAPRLSSRSQTPPLASSVGTSGECWELDRTDLRVMRRLGGGQYGEVYEAIWLSRNSKVAVKTLRLDCAMGEREFLQEARVMTALRHPNLVKLLGVVSRERPFYIVTEFMSYGNLQDFLRSRQARPEGVNLLPIVPVLLRFAVDVAAAMQYLESRHFIHRDLAARNCLVTEELEMGEAGFASTGAPDRLLVKVGDFGLARLIGGTSGKGASSDAAYTANAQGQFPIKWTAPEGLAYQRFSTKSDVWAFGILLWELVTYGASPYPSVELSGVYALLERGYRMEQPADCPNEVYQIMRDCWRWEPTERPSFAEMKNRLSSILEGNDQQKSTDRFYEQLNSLPPPPQPLVPAPPPRPQQAPMETSTFGVPSTFSAADPGERPRSGSLSSPSPSKATNSSVTNGNNGNIARCRPHNFSFRPTTTNTPSTAVAGNASAPSSSEHPSDPSNNNLMPPPSGVIGSQTPRSCSGDSLSVEPTGAVQLRRGSSDNRQLQQQPQLEAVPHQQSSAPVITNNNSNNNNNNSLLVTPARGYGSLNPTAAVQPAITPGVPPKPADFANRVTAELAEQMRKRRALAEQDQEKQPPAAVVLTSSSSETNNTTGKGGVAPATNITLQRHSTDPVATRPPLNGPSHVRQQTQPPPGPSNANASASSAPQTLVSGDGRPVAPVKPCLRRLQGDYSPTSAVVQPSAIGRPAAVLLRGPSPSSSNYTAPSTIVPPSSVNLTPSSVNWTWDDVHRLCQSVIAALVEESTGAAVPASSMTQSTVGRLPTPLPMAGLLVDLAAALDSLADSLPPRSRFQVRQLVIAMRHSSTSSAASSTISSAQINNVLNLIPPPSLLTTSSSSISTSSSLNNSSHHEIGDQLGSSTNSSSSSGTSSSNKGPSGLPPNGSQNNPPPVVPAGVLC